MFTGEIDDKKKAEIELTKPEWVYVALLIVGSFVS